MGLNKVTTILLKIILINFIITACLCQKQKGGKGKPGGGMTKKPADSETCTCETINNLCQGSDTIDIRIANQEEESLSCNILEHQYCNKAQLTCSYRRIRSDYDLFGKHPWQVNIYDNSKDPQFIGSGVLIKTQYVLTIAHKLIPHQKTGVKLHFGEWDHSVPSCNVVRLKSSRIVIHSEYDAAKNHINDIALIKLDKKVDIAQFPHVNIACLASKLPAAGTRCVVAGWGSAHFDSYQSSSRQSSKLAEVEVPIVSHSECETTLKKTRLGNGFRLNKDSFICAGGELGRDSCSGDGGAPLMCPNADNVLEVAGLVVGGVGCKSTVPALYTNVPEFQQWIDHVISNTVDD